MANNEDIVERLYRATSIFINEIKKINLDKQSCEYKTIMRFCDECERHIEEEADAERNTYKKRNQR
jgi:hypothetical protein